MKINYTLKELYPGVFLCTIDDMYDLTMTFCRVQEFYESPHKQIRGKKFKLLDFMQLYSKHNRGHFSYPLDWGGFNVPGPIVANLYRLGIDDYNEYDKIIESIHKKINDQIEIDDNYYLIGANNNKTTVEHELCHGLYFVDKEYRKTVNKLLKGLLPAVKKKAVQALFDLGYGKAVINDELQAYFSTDFNTIKEGTHLSKKELSNLTDVVLALKANFKPYKKKIKI